MSPLETMSSGVNVTHVHDQHSLLMLGIVLMLLTFIYGQLSRLKY